MPRQYGDYGQNVEQGLRVENKFIDLFVKLYPGTKARTSTLYENKNKHIDVICERGSVTTTFDIKEQKKIHRYDKEKSNVYTWVELQNNFGGKGWIYGKEKYIAFEKGNAFVIVNRKKLLELVLKNKKEPILTENKKLIPYMQYQRKKYSNKDINVLVPYADIMKIKYIVLYDRENIF